MDREQNEAFIAAQDAVGGQHRDAQARKHHATTTTNASCLMSPDVCGLSSVCPRANTRRLLDATLLGAAAVVAAAAATTTSQPSSALPAGSITCCSSDSICAGGGSVCGNSSSGEMADEPGGCVASVVVANAAAASTNNASSSGSASAFKCPRCPRAYALSYTLERHMKYECGVAKQFGCFKCGKRFSRKDILKAHVSNTRRHCGAAEVTAAVTGSVTSEDPSNAHALAGMMLSAYNRHRDSSSLEEPIPMAPAEVLLLSMSTSPVPSSLVAQADHQSHQQQPQQHPPHSGGVESSFSVGASSSTVLHTDSRCGKQQQQQQQGHDWAGSKPATGRDRTLDPLRIRAIMPNHGKPTTVARNDYSISSTSTDKGGGAVSLVRQPTRSSALASRGVGGGGLLLRHERESRGSARITVASGLLLQSGHHATASDGGNKRFRCDYCPFSCSWRYDLKLHLKQKHGIHKKNV
uniref:C2H2-type domain-containing protein n=1 Tax=Anopheles culicifacies TaxID=139723 RepID=A0A182MCQ4_9DIPT